MLLDDKMQKALELDRQKLEALGVDPGPKCTCESAMSGYPCNCCKTRNHYDPGCFLHGD